MKNLLYLILFLTLNNLSYSQINISNFSTEYNETISDIIEIDSKIYYSFIIADPDSAYNPLYQKIYKVGLTGIITDSLDLEIDSGFSTYSLRKGMNSKVYLLQFFRGSQFCEPFIKIMRLNSDLDIDIYKEYIIEMDFIGTFNAFFFSDEMLVVLQGRINGYPDNMIRSKIFRIGEECDTLNSVIPDFTYIINIEKFPGENSYLIGFPSYWLVKSDENFNIIWNKYIDLVFGEGVHLFWHDNFDLTIITTYVPFFYTYQQIGIINTDTNFYVPDYDIIHYGNNNLPDIVLSNGSFYNENYGYIIASFDHGFIDPFMGDTNLLTIRNYSSDFNLVWERTFSHPDTTFYLPILLDVGDGFIMGGSKYCPYDSIPNFDVFLYKFDYNGNFYSIMERSAGKVIARIYPNPGRDYFNVNLYLDYTDVEIALYDIFGRKVLQQKITQKNERINTPLLLPGTYICKILKDGKTIYTEKWVKN